MKLLNTAILVLWMANIAFTQSIEFGPAQGKPQLRSHAAQESLQQAITVRQLTGSSPAFLSEDDRAEDCPPVLEGYFVLAGESIEITLDTFGLMVGEDPASLTIENGAGLQLGTAQLDTTILLTYTATSGFTGAATESVQLKLSQPGHDTIFQVQINVHRQPKEVVVQTQSVQPESITSVCLDNELDFPRPKYCSRSFDWPDDYDGKGFTAWHLSSYAFPDTCLLYYASRFPGVDTVCIQICDDWGVCDLFKVPYRIQGDTLSIASQPFFDDFSSYEGPYPTSDLWLDKSVYRNNTFAKDPPSIGLVTFDGLNHKGDVYNTTSGVGDRLTSKAIDLSGFNASNNVSLRFFIAPKGYGLAPEDIDIFTVEFRNNQREWVTVATFNAPGAIPLDSFPPFLFNGIAVDDPQFFHKAFQFRFSANTSSGGIVDLWHIDYVQLSKDIFPNNNNFNDIAFTQPPSSILRQYTSMPWRHFEKDIPGEITNIYDVHLFNQYDVTAILGNSNVSFTETTTNTPFNQDFKVFDSGQNIPEKTHFSIDRTVPAASYDGIIDALENIPSSDFRNLELKYDFVYESSGIYTVNNTVKINTPFSNYFSHDDGTGEWQLYFAHSQGVEQFASKYHANVTDTLKAVQIMFQHVNGDVQEQLFNLKIWVDSLQTTPVLQRNLLKPFYPSNVFDTLQGFTTYVLDDYDGTLTPVVIPAGKDFYVGFQQASNVPAGIPIGFDLQNPCECTWANLNGSDWFKLSSNLAGALMIRPVFGDTYTTSSTKDPVISEKPVALFPNPTTGLLHFEMNGSRYEDYQVSVFNQLGQLVVEQSLAPSLDLEGVSTGIYYVKIVNKQTGKLQTERIIVAKD